ncbi:MAG: response regulator [Candidatus Omnitrophica bacterium]|nr:response regulator [Candidatus Omnitrophota bacterium]
MEPWQMRILIIDDEKDLTELLKVRLEVLGYVVSIAHAGKIGLAKARTEKPDLILLDVMLPDLDGYSTLRELRKEEETKDIPVIMLTAKEEDKIGDLFYLQKISGFVQKPFEEKELLYKIKIALAKPRKRTTNGKDNNNG